MKINYFDDSKLSRFIMQSAFEQTQHQLQIYPKPGDYHKIIAESLPDVIISDSSMPGTSGAKLISNLKPLYPMIIFIVHTGDTTPEAQIIYKKMGFAGIIPKPIDIDNIVTVFESILAGKDTFNTP